MLRNETQHNTTLLDGIARGRDLSMGVSGAPEFALLIPFVGGGWKIASITILIEPAGEGEQP